MNNMFYEATSFNQNISNWDVSNVVYHSNFANGSSLENIHNPFYEDTKPVITLLGNATVTLIVGDTYTDAGATATDDIDGNITSNIQVVGLPIDTSVEGEHTITYSVSDSAGNVADVVTRRVIVYSACDEATAITREALMTMIGNGEDVTQVNTCKITDMSYLFDGGSTSPYPQSQRETVKNFNQDISGWDTSRVTNMKSMFNHAEVFNQPLNSWNVSSVTNMASMFSSASVFNQPLNSWDVSSVTNMASMFSSTSAFNQPLNSWDVSAVTDMNYMFYYARVFNQPLNSWDVSSVTNMYAMFTSALVFNQPLSHWDVSHVTNMGYMFYYATSFNQNICNWDVSNVGYHYDFARGSSLNDFYNPFK